MHNYVPLCIVCIVFNISAEFLTDAGLHLSGIQPSHAIVAYRFLLQMCVCVGPENLNQEWPRETVRERERERERDFTCFRCHD